MKRIFIPLLLAIITLFALLPAACQSRDGYFGRVKKPTARRLVFENRGEPSSLDPQFQLAVIEYNIEDALFDSLVRLDPIALEPTAAIATHYERNPEATRFVFYLRGHPQPRGIRLPNTNDLRERFRNGQFKEDLARGHAAPPDSIPARWSDGRTITAHDFVYSWQRFFNPKTGNGTADAMTFIQNSAEILAGQLAPAALGVRALDDWTLEVLLIRPCEYFLSLLDLAWFFAVPRQAIEAAEARGAPASWTVPGHIVTSGPFQIAEWRPYEKIVVRKNPNYWEADLTGLDEIVFLPITDNLTNVNLYRTGDADIITSIPSPWIPTLATMRDHQSARLQYVFFVQCNTQQPPLDNVLVRYALNMATDKGQVAKLFQGGQTPAQTLVPPLMGYQPPSSVSVLLSGRTFDVSSYNPAAARELLALAGFPEGVGKDGQRLHLDYIYRTGLPVGDDLAEVLRRQWRDNLGIDLLVTKMDVVTFYAASGSGQYKGLSQDSITFGPEPALFLDTFYFTPQDGGMFWKPKAFDQLVKETKATVDFAVRMKKLAEADRMIMEGMPLIPLVDDSRDLMVKPYVKGLPLNAVLEFRFKYAWVETQ